MFKAIRRIILALILTATVVFALPTAFVSAASDPKEEDKYIKEVAKLETEKTNEKGDKEVVPYNLGFKADSKVLYFTGEVENNILKTTEDNSQAIELHLETTEDKTGYHLYFIEEYKTEDGEKATKKIYIDVVAREELHLVTISQAVNTWAFNDEYDTLTCTIDGEEYFLGSFANNKEISLISLEYVKDSNVCFLYATAVEDNTNLMDSLGITAVCVLIVFIMLILLALVVGSFSALSKGKKKSVEEEQPAEPVQYAQPSSLKLEDIKDEDMMVAALVATIDYHEETKEDVRVVSIKQIG